MQRAHTAHARRIHPPSWRAAWALAWAAQGGWCAAPSSELPVLPEVDVTADRLQEVQQKYPDLQSDHALNPYRVAPSSRLSVQTFTADDIEAIHPTDVFDLLNHAVGVLTLYQGRKVPYSVRIRGDLYFAYIIDGVYVPSETAARILQSFPVNLIEQVDVVRDATALTLAPMVDFGRPSGAPNDGYIVIRTRRPLSDEGRINAWAERFHGDGLQTYAGTVQGEVYVSGFASHAESAGAPEAWMARHAESWSARLGYAHGPLKVELACFDDSTRQQYQAADPSESALGLQRWRVDPIRTQLSSLNLSMSWDARHTTTLVLSEDRMSATMIAGTALSDVAPRVFDNLETIRHLDLKHTVRLDDTLLRTGLQQMHWFTPTGASYYEGYPREERIVGAFATIEHTLLKDRLVADLALRRDQQEVIQGVDHYYAYQMLFQQPGITHRTLPEDRFLSAGLAWTPARNWQFNGRLYTALQGATDSVPAVDNKTLHPEHQHKAELGLSWSGGQALQTSWTLFDTRIANAKYPAKEVRDTNGLTTSLWDETAVHRVGLETIAKGQLPLWGGMLDYSLGWTWLTGDTTSEDYGRTSPRHTLSLTSNLHHGPWDLGVAVTNVDVFQSNWKAVDDQFHPIGYFTRLDLSMARRFALASAAAKGTLYVRNALNEHYETQLGYRDPGIVFGAELSLTF
jgi:hypothetical protein